ncbi:IS66 family transposase [Bacillus albus]|uniref:IS66 family transposase n=1 Tax=Bacillus albus TaxID=2026189 RepID=UPI003D235934
MFIYTDETNFQVLLEQGRDTTKKSYLWLYRQDDCHLTINLQEQVNIRIVFYWL